jgi:hypothetical protein
MHCFRSSSACFWDIAGRRKRRFKAVLISGLVQAWVSSVHLFLDGHLRCREMRWKLGDQVPGQEFVDTVDRMIGDALQDMA